MGFMGLGFLIAVFSFSAFAHSSVDELRSLKKGFTSLQCDGGKSELGDFGSSYHIKLKRQTNGAYRLSRSYYSGSLPEPKPVEFEQVAKDLECNVPVPFKGTKLNCETSSSDSCFILTLDYCDEFYCRVNILSSPECGSSWEEYQFFTDTCRVKY